MPAVAKAGGEFNSRRGLGCSVLGDNCVHHRDCSNVCEAGDFGGGIANRPEMPEVPVLRDADCNNAPRV